MQMMKPRLPTSTDSTQANAAKLEVALGMHQQGKLDQAEALYKEILQSESQHFDALQLMATIAIQRKNSASAVELFDQALKINPDHANSLNNCGTALLNLKRYEEALASYDRAIEIEPDLAEALYNRGNALLNLKRHEQALASYKRAVKINPYHAQALNNIGNALCDLKRPEEALESYDRALQIKPDYVEALINRGTALRDLERHEQALDSYDRAIKVEPGHTEALNNRGIALQSLKRYEEALASYDIALKIKPDFAEALYNHGNALHDLKRNEEALDSYNRALKIKPDYAKALNNRGTALLDLKRDEDALDSYNYALKIEPDFAEAENNRGNALHKLKRHEEALDSYDRALKIEPNQADTLNNRGNALWQLKRHEQALASYDRALEIEPGHAEALNNRGTVLLDLNRLDEALASYDQALKIKPDYVEALSNRGNALRDLNRYEEALESYERALKIKPDYEFLYGLWLHTKMKLCDWSDAENQFAQLAEQVERAEKASIPFSMLAFSSSPALQRKSAEIWVQAKHPKSNALLNIAKHLKHDKIRIGYFSADFRNHPVAFLTAELFEKHDKSKFELTAFSFGPDTNDDMSARVAAAFDQFFDVRSQSDKEVAMLARRLGIDIAIDLGGHTLHCRTGIFAMRPAPIQVSYLGYLGTMGAEYFDYLIADATVIPETDRQHYAEKIAYLPSYQANDTQRLLADKAFTREELGLPRTGFVFCCFNNNYKITPATFDGWMRILKQVEGSVLWLYVDNAKAAVNLKKEAGLRGVNSERLVFAGRIPVAEYLARYRMADLFLDTLPYNAGTTASDALWAGLPVLTCLGETFAGRVAASLLNAIQLPELIASTPEAYEALAVELAGNPGKLREIKRKLADNRLTTPLFDIQRFTRNIEAAYTAMYERYQADLAPEHFYVHPQANIEFLVESSRSQPLDRQEIIEIISATRLSESEFWHKAPLGISLRRLAHDTRLVAHIAFENQRGLPDVYNAQINAPEGHGILIFIHDDVWIDDYFLVDRVISGLKKFDVIGIAGNRRRVQNQPAWLFTDNNLTLDTHLNLSGSVAHGSQPFGAISVFGAAPAECELLDGVFLAAKKSGLTAAKVQFDPHFDFHFYDMDFCRSARKSGLRLGTWPICLTHQSRGSFGGARWNEKYRLYQEKWEA